MKATLAVLAALVLAVPAVIWTQGNSDRPFRFRGRTWVNQQAFIEWSALCDAQPHARTPRPGRRGDCRACAQRRRNSLGYRRRRRCPLPRHHRHVGRGRPDRSSDRPADRRPERRLRGHRVELPAGNSGSNGECEVVRDGARHHRRARCEVGIAKRYRGRPEHLHARTSAAACSAGRRSRRATRSSPRTTASSSCTRRCPAAPRRPTTWATPRPTRSATGWASTTPSRAAAASNGDHVTDTPAEQSPGVRLPGRPRHLPRQGGHRPDPELHGLHGRRVHEPVHGGPGRAHGRAVQVLSGWDSSCSVPAAGAPPPGSSSTVGFLPSSQTQAVSAGGAAELARDRFDLRPVCRLEGPLV